MRIDPVIKEELKQYLLQKLHSHKQYVTIIAPYPMGREDIDMVKAHFSDLAEAHIETAVDPSLLGGFIIKFGTKMIDLSLKRKLDDIVHAAVSVK